MVIKKLGFKINQIISFTFYTLSFEVTVIISEVIDFINVIITIFVFLEKILNLVNIDYRSTNNFHVKQKNRWSPINHFTFYQKIISNCYLAHKLMIMLWKSINENSNVIKYQISNKGAEIWMTPISGNFIEGITISTTHIFIYITNIIHYLYT